MRMAFMLVFFLASIAAMANPRVSGGLDGYIARAAKEGGRSEREVRKAVVETILKSKDFTATDRERVGLGKRIDYTLQAKIIRHIRNNKEFRDQVGLQSLVNKDVAKSAGESFEQFFDHAERVVGLVNEKKIDKSMGMMLVQPKSIGDGFIAIVGMNSSGKNAYEVQLTLTNRATELGLNEKVVEMEESGDGYSAYMKMTVRSKAEVYAFSKLLSHELVRRARVLEMLAAPRSATMHGQLAIVGRQVVPVEYNFAHGSDPKLVELAAQAAREAVTDFPEARAHFNRVSFLTEPHFYMHYLNGIKSIAVAHNRHDRSSFVEFEVRIIADTIVYRGSVWLRPDGKLVEVIRLGFDNTGL